MGGEKEGKDRTQRKPIYSQVLQREKGPMVYYP